MAADLSDLASIDALADAVLARGGVDILINNSGGPPPGLAATTSRGDWLVQFEAMAANLFHLTGRLLPGMRERRWGRIMTIASSGVEQPIPNLALSNGIRAAVVGWSKTLASEVAADGVTVNVVLPGRIQTSRVDELDEGERPPAPAPPSNRCRRRRPPRSPPAAMDDPRNSPPS